MPIHTNGYHSVSLNSEMKELYNMHLKIKNYYDGCLNADEVASLTLYGLFLCFIIVSLIAQIAYLCKKLSICIHEINIICYIGI